MGLVICSKVSSFLAEPEEDWGALWRASFCLLRTTAVCVNHTMWTKGVFRLLQGTMCGDSSSNIIHWTEHCKITYLEQMVILYKIKISWNICSLKTTFFFFLFFFFSFFFFYCKHFDLALNSCSNQWDYEWISTKQNSAISLSQGRLKLSSCIWSSSL